MTNCTLCACNGACVCHICSQPDLRLNEARIFVRFAILRLRGGIPLPLFGEGTSLGKCNWKSVAANQDPSWWVDIYSLYIPLKNNHINIFQTWILSRHCAHSGRILSFITQLNQVNVFRMLTASSKNALSLRLEMKGEVYSQYIKCYTGFAPYAGLTITIVSLC